jgi:hypothetical protein
MEELCRSRILLRAPINHPLPYFIQATKFTIKTFVSRVCVNIHLHIHVHAGGGAHMCLLFACGEGRSWVLEIQARAAVGLNFMPNASPQARK